MTQKELLYLEDAIGHEQNIISICEESINLLNNKELQSFIKKELKIHRTTEKNLIEMLEDKSNE